MRRRSSIVGLSLLSLGLAGFPAGPGEAWAQNEDRNTAEEKATKRAEDRVIPAPTESAEKADASRERAAAARAAAEERAAWLRRQAELQGAYHPYPPPYYSPYYHLWYGLPQSYRTRRYPPSITHVPRLGLQHTYLDAYQMGIRIPDDIDPLDVAPNLGEFRGVVGEARAALAEIEEESAPGTLGPVESIDRDPVMPLMKAGKYREAGRILAERFGESEDPGTALLLAEVFFALGKPAHAELLLRNALESRRVLEALPADVASHFSSADEFESKVQDLGSGGETKLLAGYLLLHSRTPESGIDLLGKLAAGDPADRAAARLYRHYLSRAFKE
ncbi:MAG TPA: hypothetical protein VMT52_14240 [Planctomycetota bacterium]|nr:hypothetical protein [Planctomycetota bacterium]